MEHDHEPGDYCLGYRIFRPTKMDSTLLFLGLLAIFNGGIFSVAPKQILESSLEKNGVIWGDGFLVGILNSSTLW